MRQPDATGPHLLAVVTDGGVFVDWVFDTIVDTFDDNSAFTIDGPGSVGYDSGLGTTTIRLEYSESQFPGSPYLLGNAAGLVFSPPGTFTYPATGTTT